MRHALIFTLLFTLLTNANSSSFDLAVRSENAKLLPSASGSIQIRFGLNEATPQEVSFEGNDFTAFRIEGEGTLWQHGMPALPAISRFVVVPADAALELVVTESTEPREFRAASPPLLIDEEAIGEPTILPNELGLYPPNIAEMSEPILLRGVRMVMVTVYPVQYDFSTGSYLQHEGIETEIRPVAGEVINPSIHSDSRNYSPDFLKMMRGFAINGEEVGRDDPDRDAYPTYNGHYLVVSHATLVQHIAPFIEWRRKAGYKMDIYAVPANDATSDNTIRQGIQTRYTAYRNAGQEPFDLVHLVGDRSDYYEMHEAEAVLEAPQGNGGFGARHADYLYSCLEGNDEVPDVGLGRWPGGGANRLGLMVGRTLANEMTPEMDDPSWFTRGGAISQHWGNGAENAFHVTNPSMIRAAEALLKNLGYTEVRFHELFDWDQYGRQTGPVFQDLLNDGANVVIARSENYFWCTRNPQRNYFDQDIEDNTCFPIRLNASGHGEWSADMEYRTGGANHLKGWAAVTFSWNGPVTGISNSLVADETRALMLLDQPVGWAYSYAIGHAGSHIPGLQGQMPVGRSEHNIFGEPGYKPWKGVPRLVEMEAPETVTEQTKFVEVFVHQPESENPVAGAKVTFYAPGSMPAFNNANYAAYDDYWMVNTRTDANGIARLVVDEGMDLVINTNLFITVTGDDIVPVLHTAPIRAPQAAVEMEEYVLTEISGNDNDQVNPGEEFSVLVTAANPGEGVAEGVTARILSLSPYVMVEEDNNVEFGDIQSGEIAQGNREVSFTLSQSCPDAVARPMLTPTIEVEFTSGESIWRSAFNLDTHAPHLEFRSVFNGDIVPDSAAAIDIEIANIGRVASGELTAVLFGTGYGVSVIDGNSSYPNIAPDRTARVNGGRFDISGNKIVVPGSRSSLYMILSSETGFVDTTYFTVQVMRPRAGAPIGPDNYGYVCFDDTDTLWDLAPEYDWEEINPDDDDAEFDGRIVQFDQQQDPRNIGKAVAIPLPFTTRFYGLDFDTVTVATNGFVIMGNRPRMTNHHNFPLDQGIGGTGMIAPFWDDLRRDQNSRVLFFFDEEDSRFIVEWYRMRPATGNGELTFQVVIYDKDVWITESGDPNILFQYRTIQNTNNVRGGDQEWTNNNPFASVGINSPNTNSGINYTWNNVYPTGAAQLANGRALLFSTSVRFRSGILYGMVTDAATGAGVEGATIFTKHGFIATSDATGYWRIPEALADIDFEITAHSQGYNDSAFTGENSLVVAEGDSLEINFDLLHPEFTPTAFELSDVLDPGYTVDLGFTLINSGNGPLDWTAEKRLLGDANANPWELRRRYNVGQNLDDDRIEGIVFAEDKFFLSGANVSANLEDNLIYVLSREGELLDSFPQIASTRWGYKDLDWDGELIWAAGEGVILALATDGQEAIRFDDPLSPTEKIACDRENGILYLSGTTTSIMRLDRAGNVLGENFDRKHLRIYGLAYWPEDPDGYNLYIVNSPGQGIYRVHKMNTETGDTLGVFQFATEESGQQQSAWITNEFDVYSWVMMTIQSLSRDRGGDRIEIHQLDARKDWMQLDDWDGRLESGESQDFTMTLNSTGLPDTLFQGEMLFRHNADSGRAHIMISLQVIGDLPPERFNLATPADGDTVTALPLHGDSLNVEEIFFNWSPSYDPNAYDTVITYIQTFAVGEQSVSFALVDTFSIVNIDTLGLPVWFDQPLTWWVRAVSDPDTVESAQRHRLNVTPNGLDVKEQLPVEFGLQSIYPSPFNGRTTIRFGADLAEKTSLVAYDLMGREAARLFDDVPRIGYHAVTWNAATLPSGVYVIRLESAGRVRVAKLALIK